MQTKLTLRLEADLIRKGKRHAGKVGKSLSRLVADYLTLLDEGTGPSSGPLTPRVRSLLGALAGHGGSEEEYRRHVERKHR